MQWHVYVLADQPECLPRLSYHLTARPFASLDAPRDDYLQAVEGICRYLATLQDDRGAIVDPYLRREHQYATPYFAYPVGVLLKAGRASDLRDAGIRAMDHATACFAAGTSGIPDRHGEFFLAPLAESLELYRGQVDEATWRTWHERLSTPLVEVIDGPAEHTNNWRTYAMKGEWLRKRAGLVERDAASKFIADAWVHRTQRERIALDRWNLYQDWSSDPQSHAVEAVGRGNLLALVTAGYDGPHHEEIERCVRRGTQASLLWQAPDGQCPPNGRTDNHVFNDVLYQLAFEVLAEDALARGDAYAAGQFRRAAQLNLRSIDRWRRASGEFAGSFYVTKNRFAPADRVGYQPASQYTNYNGAVAYHLAEAYRARRSEIEEQPAPTEIGGYVIEADPRFASCIANAGGMQLVANLRGDTVTKYGEYWTPLGIVRFGRAGWDGRLGPADGAHDAKTGRGVSFAPTWREGDRWIRLAERAEHYRGTVRTEFVHPSLVRMNILWHTVTGHGGPTFRQELVITPDGVLATLTCTGDVEFGLTLPLLMDDGQPLDVRLDPPCISVSYRSSEGAAGDEQNFLLLGDSPQVTPQEPIRCGVGILQPARFTSRDSQVQVFVYPRMSADPPARDVFDSFELRKDGFASCLGSVSGNVYVGRMAAGGHGDEVDLNGDGTPEVRFASGCGFLLQTVDGQPLVLEADRAVQVEFGEEARNLEPFRPHVLVRHGEVPDRLDSP